MKRLGLVACLVVIGAFLGSLVHGYRQGVIAPEVNKALEKADEVRVIIALKDPVSVAAPLELRRRKVAEALEKVLDGATGLDCVIILHCELIGSLANIVVIMELVRQPRLDLSQL